MEVFQGKSIFKGVAIGPLLYYGKKETTVRREKIEDTDAEVARYKDAREKSVAQLRQLHDDSVKKVGEENAAIFDVHAMLMEDEDFCEAIENAIRTQNVNAEYAVAVAGENFSKMFAEMEDEYFKARSADMKDISERLIRVLTGEDEKRSFDEPSIIIADDLNGMANSDLILNLNPENKIGDTSWIEPGKAAWSWWSSGGDSPVEYHTQKDYIDFAAANGWNDVCIDFGWAMWDDSEAKLKELCAYAAERGIGIYLWYGVNNTGHEMYKDSQGHTAYPYYSLLDEATITREFARISAIGVKGVKVDYYESDTQETMRQMHLCAEIAAKNHLMVLFLPR